MSVSVMEIHISGSTILYLQLNINFPEKGLSAINLDTTVSAGFEGLSAVCCKSKLLGPSSPSCALNSANA